MRPSRAVVSAVLSVTCAVPLPATAADESFIALAQGPGRDKVQAACSVCHSLDYVIMNSPFLDKAGWQKTVNKMVSVYGAPLTAEDVAVIVAYLERHYGKAPESSSPDHPVGGKPQPAP